MVPNDQIKTRFFMAFPSLPPWHMLDYHYHHYLTFRWTRIKTSPNLFKMYHVFLEGVDSTLYPFGRMYDNIAATIFGFVCQVARARWTAPLHHELFSLEIPARYRVHIRPGVERTARIPEFQKNLSMVFNQRDIRNIFLNKVPTWTEFNHQITYKIRNNSDIEDAWTRLKSIFFEKLIPNADEESKHMEETEFDEGPYEGGENAYYSLATDLLPPSFKVFIREQNLNNHILFG